MQQSGTKSAYIAFGSNMPKGDLAPHAAVAAAIAALGAQVPGEMTVSPLYHTPAFPPGAGPEFVNAVVGADWAGDAETLLRLLHGIEADFGRTRTHRWEARIMDLDLLALGAEILPDTATQTAWAGLPPTEAATRMPDRLILPHPRLAERGFVLVPFADIAPNWCHPVTGASVQEMLARLPAAETEGIRPVSAAQT